MDSNKLNHSGEFTVEEARGRFVGFDLAGGVLGGEGVDGCVVATPAASSDSLRAGVSTVLLSFRAFFSTHAGFNISATRRDCVSVILVTRFITKRQNGETYLRYHQDFFCGVL